MVLTVIVFVFTYVYIYYRIRSGRKRSGSMGNTTHVREKRKNHFIPFWIIASYIMFIFIPYLIYTIVFYVMKMARRDNYVFQVVHKLLNIMFFLNFTTDALIYILFHQSIRKKFLLMIRWKRTTTRRYQRSVLSDIPLTNLTRNE